jgi:hypothetical protein
LHLLLLSHNFRFAVDGIEYGRASSPREGLAKDTAALKCLEKLTSEERSSGHTPTRSGDGPKDDDEGKSGSRGDDAGEHPVIVL